jgi:hypothetical protein
MSPRTPAGMIRSPERNECVRSLMALSLEQ